MNVGVGMQTSARIYFEYSISIWALLNMGESLLLIFGTFIHIEGLTVTYVHPISPMLRLMYRVVSTLLTLISQFSGLISLNVPTWLAGVCPPLHLSTKLMISHHGPSRSKQQQRSN
jgi:hypothetical protein